MKTEFSLPCTQQSALDPIMRHLNAIHTVTPCSFNIHLNITIPSTPWSPKGFFSIQTLNPTLRKPFSPPPWPNTCMCPGRLIAWFYLPSNSSYEGPVANLYWLKIWRFGLPLGYEHLQVGSFRLLKAYESLDERHSFNGYGIRLNFKIEKCLTVLKSACIMFTYEYIPPRTYMAWINGFYVRTQSVVLQCYKYA
jgi:hypothetical protein